MKKKFVLLCLLFSLSSFIFVQAEGRLIQGVQTNSFVEGSTFQSSVYFNDDMQASKDVIEDVVKYNMEPCGSSSSGNGELLAFFSRNNNKGSDAPWINNERSDAPDHNKTSAPFLRNKRTEAPDVNYSRSTFIRNERSHAPRRSYSIAGSVNSEPVIAYHGSGDQLNNDLGVWFLGLSLGTSHSITDIQGNKGMAFGDFVDYHTNYNSFNHSLGVFTKCLVSNWFSLKGGMNYARFSGANTNKSFENDVFEFFIKTEFHAPFLKFSPSSIYLFSGLSAFFSDLTVRDANGEVMSADDDFSHIQPAMPIGLGYSFQFNNGFRLGYEFGWRYTLFSHLDGYEGDDKHYDSFFFNQLSLSYALN